jgi:two-component system, NtrC family, sensor histidine kinase HydH
MATVALVKDDEQQRVRIAERATALFGERRDRAMRRVDRMFVALMIGQWVFGILMALFLSPYGWTGKVKAVHFHVYIAVLLGGALSALPIALAVLRPGSTLTRHTIAVSQMLWSALLIHLSGGRIETHFHVFGSLAFLAFYADWKVLPTATAVVAADHLIRGLLWPESVYGVTNPEWWRFLEHVFWVLFMDTFLILSCLNSAKDMKMAAQQQAEVEVLSENDEIKSLALQMVLKEVGPQG